MCECAVCCLITGQTFVYDNSSMYVPSKDKSHSPCGPRTPSWINQADRIIFNTYPL